MTERKARARAKAKATTKTTAEVGAHIFAMAK
jgi:hypothetical protein